MRLFFALIWMRTEHFSLLIPSYKERSSGNAMYKPVLGVRYFWIKTMSLALAERDREACTSHRPTWIIAHECRTSERACVPARRDASLCAAIKSGQVNKLRSLKAHRRIALRARGFPFIFYILSFPSSPLLRSQWDNSRLTRAVMQLIKRDATPLSGYSWFIICYSGM